MKTKRSRAQPITIRLLIGIHWKSYSGEPDNGLGELPVTPHMAIYMRYAGSICFIGKAVKGEEIELALPEGDTVEVYLVGFPEVPAKYKMLSDIAEIDGVDYVQRRLRGEDGRLRYVTVSGVDDPDDVPIEPGMAVTIRIRRTLTLDLRGEGMVSAAPAAQRMLTTSWGRIKMRHNLE